VNCLANYIRDNRAKTYVLPLSNADAKHYRYGLVGLKGFLFKRFAECIAREGTLLQKVYDEPEVFVQIVDTEPVQLEIPLGLPEVKVSPKSIKKPRIGKSEDKELIPIPALPPAPNLHLGMQYFIPEWDDRVDPRYDFLRDALTPGRDPYEDDIYAHQIYSTPNYNGILVSKGIVERSKKKKAQIEKIGIHKFIRFSLEDVALGGLARTPSKEIIEILCSTRPHLKSNTQMHLFGVGRINAIPAFHYLGVTSFDSASPLRSAWLDSKANYHTLSGVTYAAVRIPPVNKHGVRVKRVLAAGISNWEELKQLEQDSLKAMRDFGSGNLTVEETLSVLLAYDKFLELPVDGKVKPEAQARRLRQHAQMYRKLLEDKPWESCGCPICKKIGVEVVIFRGNDRNRRRGFHNTYIFHKRFNALLKDRKS
jgi:hypothetical protein